MSRNRWSRIARQVQQKFKVTTALALQSCRDVYGAPDFEKRMADLRAQDLSYTEAMLKMIEGDFEFYDEARGVWTSPPYGRGEGGETMSTNKQRAISDLREGRRTVLKCHGNSMRPRILSGAKLTLEPVSLCDVQVGDAVLCKVRGNIYVHLVSALKGGDDNRQAQISNNSGHVNGWTTAVYGRVVEVENP